MFFIYLFCSTGTWMQGLHPWATLLAPFLWRVFQKRVSGTICLGWLWTAFLLFSASWVARIAGVTHWCLAFIFFF
jgi:hypothetical protein